MIQVGPTGQITQGHVLDVSRRAFERALRDYDSLLYVKWNPKKLRGWGCWEIRRRPEKYVVLESVTFEGNTYTKVGPKELDIISNVLDCAFLNYDQLRKIKSMDTWKKDGSYGKDFVRNMEAREEAFKEGVKKKDKEDLAYAARQNKTAIRDFKDMIQSGLNPAQIADHWDKKQGS